MTISTLGTNDILNIGAGSSPTTVAGSNGTSDKVIAAAGVVINVDQNVERVELSGAASSYTYSVTGNVVKVLSGTTVVASIGAGANAQTIAFADGSATLNLTAMNTATLGGKAIPTTAGAVADITLVAADKSASAVAVTPVTPAAAYTIAPSANTVIEGNAVTFTVTAVTAPAADTVLNYQIVGAAVGTTIPAATAADFPAINGSVTIKAGATTGTFTVIPTNDGVVEGYEGFKVALLDSTLNTVASSTSVAIADAASTAGPSFNLTTGTDAIVPTGNTTVSGTSNGALATFTSGDSIVASGTNNTLNLTDLSTGGTWNPAILGGVKVSGIQTANLSSGEAISVDTTSTGGTQGWTGLTSLTLSSKVAIL